MTRRFVPVPYDAMAQCGNARERLCVLALYERAHSFRWAAMLVPVREFAEAGDLRLESAVALLDALEAAGLLVRTRSAVKGRADKIRVLDPSADSPVERRVEHETERQDPPRTEPKPPTTERSVEHETEHPRAIVDTRASEPNREPNRTRTSEAAPPPLPDLANPGPPGDDPAIPGSFYSRLWLDAVRAAELLDAEAQLSRREQSAVERIARDAGGDRERIERTARWIRTSGAFEAKRARESVAGGVLKWLLEDWPALDRLARANGTRHTPKRRTRETPDEIEARLAREAQGGGGDA